MSELEVVGRGATDCRKDAAFEELDALLGALLEEELCLCALFKLGKAGGTSSSSADNVKPGGPFEEVASLSESLSLLRSSLTFEM